MDVFEDALHRLVLVHHTVHPKAPYRGTPEGGEQHPPQRVAEGVTEATLERLEAEFGDVRVVLALGHLDQVGANQSGQINRHGSDSLLRVKLNDELFLCSGRDRVAGRTHRHPASQLLVVNRQPSER
jgi:hypothetical protein